jgi:signal transduction histidine kinase
LSATELEQLLTSLHLGVLGLQTLIDNLLESASIEAGHFRVRPRPADLNEIMAEAIRTMQPILDRHSQHLVVGLPASLPKVLADPRRTVQVLVNLLSNASKYGPNGIIDADQAELADGGYGEDSSPQAEIEMGATVEGNWVRVSVADSGPGIPPEFRKDLFRRFAHPEMENGQAQMGAGLGLSVVKAIVEAHGGAVGIDSGPHGGSVFWFTLPKVDTE